MTTNLETIMKLYENPRNDFIVLENNYTPEEMCRKMDDEYPIFPRMKCYSMIDANWEQLERFFLLIYKSCNQFEVLREKPSNLYIIPYNTIIHEERHNVVNNHSDPSAIYLEIGVEYGYTFKNVHFERDNKVGVDPDPKFNYTADDNIITKTSDDYFADCDDEFDVIFIDGMHQCEYVLRDFNNAIKHLKTCENTKIFIDDILPQSCREQLKVPIKHRVEKGILKYGEPWTGDVWKTMYYILQHYFNDFEIYYYNHQNYRGIAVFNIINKFQIPDDDETIRTINSYTYEVDFPKYLELLKNVM
jgi:hypothetical protein